MALDLKLSQNYWMKQNQPYLASNTVKKFIHAGG